MNTRRKSAVFLDRDGTLIREREYLKDPAQVEIFPGAAKALAALEKAGFLLILVTNQSGVGRGYFTMEEVAKVHGRLEELLLAEGIHLAKIYVAPEAPDQPSHGRKPSPQFLFDAAQEFDIDLGSSFMIGDKLIDVECGWNAGVKKNFLVRTGYGAKTEKECSGELMNFLAVDDLSKAVEWVLANGVKELSH